MQKTAVKALSPNYAQPLIARAGLPHIVLSTMVRTLVGPILLRLLFRSTGFR
jgi:hypothetical protein